MTDKERIEVYVNRMPKDCRYCPMNAFNPEGTNYCKLYQEINRGKSINIWVTKRHKDCPLKTIKSVQNQKAASALEKVKKIVNDRLTPDKKYLEELEEDWQIGKDDYYEIDTRVEFCKYLIRQIDQLIKEYGGNDE